jgi:hypothetical protein
MSALHDQAVSLLRTIGTPVWIIGFARRLCKRQPQAALHRTGPAAEAYRDEAITFFSLSMRRRMA